MAQAFQSNTFQNNTFEVAVGATNYTLVCSLGSYASVGKIALLKITRTFIASSGNYSYIGQNSLGRLGFKLISSSGNYSLVGKAATLIYVPLSILATNYNLLCTKGTYTASGNSVNLYRTVKLLGANGSYALVGINNTLTYTAGVLGVNYNLIGNTGVYTVFDNTYIDEDYILDYYAGTTKLKYMVDFATISSFPSHILELETGRLVKLVNNNIGFLL